MTWLDTYKKSQKNRKGGETLPKFGLVPSMQFGRCWLKIDQHWVWYIKKAAKNHCFRLRITKCKKSNLLRPDFNRIDWFWSKTQNSRKNLQLKMSDFCHFENSEKLPILSGLLVQSGFFSNKSAYFWHFHGCTDCNIHQFLFGWKSDKFIKYWEKYEFLKQVRNVWPLLAALVVKGLI